MSLFIKFIGSIVILTIYLCLNDISNLSTQLSKENKVYVTPFHNNLNIKKIDVGQGDDIWILTNYNYLYHWCTIRKEFIYVRGTIFDFSVGSDGTVVYIDYYRSVYIRNSHDSWLRIDDGRFSHSNISICDYNTIFTVSGKNLIQGSYNQLYNTYEWRYVDSSKYFNQISCAFHDKSLWTIGYSDYSYFEYHYVYLYINYYKMILRSEVQFKQIDALSKQDAIGIDFNNTLWEYNKGTWSLIRRQIKSASINYDGDIFYIDYDNFIYKFKRY